MTKIKFKMNKSLAVVCISALAALEVSAVKTEFFDHAFNFFDKPLWNNSNKMSSWMNTGSVNNARQNNFSNPR